MSFDIGKKFGEFYTKYNGKKVEIEDPTNKYQCFDLAFAWTDYLELPRESIRHLYASEIYTAPLDATVKYFELIPNTPLGLTRVGDIVVFKGKPGHVSIANGNGNTNYFESLDQNWAGKQYATIVKHDYNSVLGWLRLRKAYSLDISVATVSELASELTKAIKEGRWK